MELKQQEKLFELWHRVRDGTLSRDDFGELVVEIHSSIKATLTEADSYSIGTREKTSLAKTECFGVYDDGYCGCPQW